MTNRGPGKRLVAHKFETNAQTGSALCSSRLPVTFSCYGKTQPRCGRAGPFRRRLNRGSHHGLPGGRACVVRDDIGYRDGCPVDPRSCPGDDRGRTSGVVDRSSRRPRMTSSRVHGIGGPANLRRPRQGRRFDHADGAPRHRACSSGSVNCPSPQRRYTRRRSIRRYATSRWAPRRS